MLGVTIDPPGSGVYVEVEVAVEVAVVDVVTVAVVVVVVTVEVVVPVSVVVVVVVEVVVEVVVAVVEVDIAVPDPVLVEVFVDVLPGNVVRTTGVGVLSPVGLNDVIRYRYVEFGASRESLYTSVVVDNVVVTVLAPLVSRYILKPVIGDPVGVGSQVKLTVVVEMPTTVSSGTGAGNPYASVLLTGGAANTNELLVSYTFRTYD